MSCVPALRCALQHWYELVPKGQKLGEENQRRRASVRDLHMIFRRQGADGLRSEVLQAASGHARIKPVHLIVGAAFFSEKVEVETMVRRSLRHERADFRIAGSYAGLYYMGRSEEVAFLLADRVILGEEEAQVVAAARDALDIWNSVRDGGRCSRCGQTGMSPSTLRQQDWVLTRAS